MTVSTKLLSFLLTTALCAGAGPIDITDNSGCTGNCPLAYFGPDPISGGGIVANTTPFNGALLIEAGAGYVDDYWNTGSWSAWATENINVDAMTAGPVRQGYADITWWIDGDGVGAPLGQTLTFTEDTPGGAAANILPGTSANGVPFLLGVPFYIGMTANGVSAASPDCTGPHCTVVHDWSSVIYLAVKFHEGNTGDPNDFVPVYPYLPDPPGSPAPEPSTFVGSIAVFALLKLLPKLHS